MNASNQQTHCIAENRVWHLFLSWFFPRYFVVAVVGSYIAYINFLLFDYYVRWLLFHAPSLAIKFFIMLTVFAGTPCQKGQQINTLRFDGSFFLFVCIVDLRSHVYVLHINLINIVLLEYYLL